EKLSKHFGEIRAVDDVSLAVGRGEIYGFLGLNGAGKTTAIRMLLGMISPTSGTAYLFGNKVTPNSCDLWARVGYMVETPHAYPDLTVQENLEIIRRLRRLPDKKSVDKVIDELRLTPYRDRKARNLSSGNAQRLGLAKALLHHPEVLILDEPANGLDPAGIVETWEMFSNLATSQDVTIFVSSHILGEIAKYATRIGIIHQGRLIQDVGADQLEQLCYKKVVVDTLDNQAAQAQLIAQGYSIQLTEAGVLESVGERAVNHPENIANILVQAGIPLTLLKVEEEDLESYFLRVVKD
ncbi:MAG: ABC transporter ATP-binding protein, partial [Firmicutes bacterium]|nr:ABC transporter ATP-binding protein [Bacillota bacterium]